jgi:hypothetical protein
VDGADRDAASLAQVVDCGFDVFSGGPERNEDSVGIVGLVFADEAVAAASELAEVFVGGLKEVKNRLGEVVARATMPCM